MATTVQKNVSLDFDDFTFSLLTKQANKAGKDFNVYISHMLAQMAEDIEDKEFYDAYIATHPDALNFLSKEESREFEKELGLWT